MKSMRILGLLVVAIGLPGVVYGQGATPAAVPAPVKLTDADCHVAGNECADQTVTFALPGSHQNRVESKSFSFGPGWSLGNSGGWRTFTNSIDYETVANRGIAQAHTSVFEKHASGDAANYFYLYADGGSTAQSDEGIEPLAVNGGETHGYFHGTVSATTGLGDTVPRLAFTSGNRWTTDEARLMDITQGTIAGHLNGTTFGVERDGGDRGGITVPALPVTNQLPLTTGWCQLTSAIPNPGGAATQATLQTVGCVPHLIGTSLPAMMGPKAATRFKGAISGTTLTVTDVAQGRLAVGQTVFGTKVNMSTTITGLGSGSGGAGTYTVSSAQTVTPGDMAAVAAPAHAEVGGQFYPEMGSIVEAGDAPAHAVFTGSIQGNVLTVNGTPNGTIAVGQYLVGTGVPSGITVVGAGPGRGTYTLSQTGNVPVAETMGATGAQTLTVALRNPNSRPGLPYGYGYMFQGGVAGEAISFDDNLAATKMRSSYLALGSVTGSDLIYTVNLKGSQQGIPLLPLVGWEPETIHSGYHLYPSCEIVQNMSTGADPQCEPNDIPWAVGDVVENPHNPIVNVTGFHLFVSQDTPTNNSGSVMIGAAAVGTGVGGNFALSQITNDNPASYYLASGGWMYPPLGYQVRGFFQTAFLSNTTPPPGGCLVCAGSNYPATTPGRYTVLGVPGFQLNYNPATGLLTDALNAPAPLLQGALGGGNPGFVAGPGVASVGCAPGYRCSNSEGELTIRANGTTSGTVATIRFGGAPLAAAPGLCTVTQNGGSGFYGIGHGPASTSSVDITAGVSLGGAVVVVDYRCTP